MKKLAKEIAKSASDLKAVDVKVLDLGELCSFTDYFVICNGTSDRHMHAIADKILMEQKKKGHLPLGVEGENKGDWVLVDFGGVVAHVFSEDGRDFYNIERLWGDAKRVAIKDVTK